MSNNPTRRRTIRAKVAVPADAMACWPLLKIIADAMRPIGDYSPATLSNYRSAARSFQQFIGFEQSAVSVTEAKLADFRAWLQSQGYHPRTIALQVDGVAAVVRFADRSLLPSRESTGRKPLADAQTAGTIDFYLVSEFFPVRARALQETTRRLYAVAAGIYSEHLGRPATLADLTDEAVSRWVAAMLDSPLKTSTINSYLITLRAFWRWAHAKGMVKPAPTIRQVRDREAPPATASQPAARSTVRRRSPAARKARRSQEAPNSVGRFVRRYLAVREVSAVYAGNLTRIAARFARFAGTAAIDELFAEDAVNEFLASLQLSPFTLRAYRGHLLSLWNAAADEDLVPYPRMRRIRSRPCPELVIQCYTLDELKKLLQAADRLEGEYANGVTRRRYWRAAILLAWDTGLRRGDVWRFKRSDVRPDGTVQVLQHKTRQVVAVKLRESTVAALAAIQHDQALRWTMDPTFFGRHFQRIVRASGVNRGSFKWLRRSSGSYVELQQPGAGGKHLGHRDPRVFGKHYDARLGGHTLPLPPEIG